MLIDFLALNGLFFIYSLVGIRKEFLVDSFALIVLTLILVLIGRFIGSYDSLTRFFNSFELKNFIFFQFLFSLILAFTNHDVTFERWFFLFFSFIAATIPYRFLVRYLNTFSLRSKGERTLLYGAGRHGFLLNKALFNSPRFAIVGFVDDNKMLEGRKIDGKYIYALGDKLDSLITERNIRHVIFSTNDIGSERKQFIIDFFKSRGVRTYNFPSPDGWITNKPLHSGLKKVRIEDILSRPELEIDEISNKINYADKRILITGGAGSIGSEILRQLLKFEPLKITIVDINETALFFLKEELKLKDNVQFLLLNVVDFASMKLLFEKENFDYVFHAAAYKHVSIVETNVFHGLKNNILGTYNVARLSHEFGINRFVLVSTDKAVRPTNVMGASKRCCELLLNIFSRNNGVQTIFITTRFGNVLGSNGSVIPIFRSQIENGGPITLTHPDITRYFMTIPEASRLVIESGRIGENNQVYVFDMGEPVRIVDMAENMIQLSGLRPYEDIDIEIVGLRPGEKLFEELLLDTETMVKSTHAHLFIAQKEFLSQEQYSLINQLINEFDYQSNSKVDVMKLVQLLKKIVPDYKSNNSPFQVLDLD